MIARQSTPPVTQIRDWPMPACCQSSISPSCYVSGHIIII